MSEYIAYFVRNDGLTHTDIGWGMALDSKSREAAIEAAGQLRPPLSANYIRIESHGRVTAWVAVAEIDVEALPHTLRAKDST